MSIPIGVADRIRRNCSDNVINDSTYRERLIEYKAYLMKSGHSEKDIDNAFCNRFLKNRRETLKKKTNKKRNDKISMNHHCESMNHHCQTFTPYGKKIVTY